MQKTTKIAVTATEAAKMLSLKVKDFLELVACGFLPQPISTLPTHKLWSVATLEEAIDGNYRSENKFRT